MRDLPETELTLSPQFKTARKFLHLLNPADRTEHFQANQACNEIPPQQSSYLFVLKDDAKPRNDPTLSERMTGGFDSVAPRLAEANIRSRVGVWVQLDTAQMLVAHCEREPEHGQGGRSYAWEGLPVVPSIRVQTGPNRGTFIWLFDGDMALADRNAIALLLAEKHCTRLETGTSALVRLPGFYSRQGEPFHVMLHGSSKRYTAEHLRGAFLGWPVEAVTVPEKPAINGHSEAKEAALRQARFKELVTKGFSVEEATTQVIAEREVQLRLERHERPKRS